MSQLIAGNIFPPTSSYANSGLQCSDNNYIIIGRDHSDSQNSCAFITKVSADAKNYIWQKTYKSMFSQEFTSIAELEDGSLIVTGFYCYSLYSSDKYILVAKFDSNGNLIWQKALGNRGVENQGYDVAATTDGGFILVGYSLSETPYTSVIKFDTDGNTQWTKTFEIGAAYSIIQTMDGGYAFTGCQFISHSQNCYAFIVKLDADGDTIWENVYKDIEIFSLIYSEIIETSNGHFAIAAQSVFMEVDACGNKLSSFQNSNYKFYSIEETRDENYVIGGLQLVDSQAHAYIAKFDKTNFDILWDNVEVLFNSSITRVLLNKLGFVVGIGYLPVNGDQSYLAIYRPKKSLVD